MSVGRLTDDRVGSTAHNEPYRHRARTAMADNMPWSEFTTRLLASKGDGWDPKTAVVGYYTRDCGMPLDNLSNTMRFFLAARMECAQGGLLARRLVQNGVKFVEVQLGGWDTHYDNFTGVASRCKEFDQAYAALISDLEKMDSWKAPSSPLPPSSAAPRKSSASTPTVVTTTPVPSPASSPAVVSMAEPSTVPLTRPVERSRTPKSPTERPFKIADKATPSDNISNQIPWRGGYPEEINFAVRGSRGGSLASGHAD